METQGFEKGKGMNFNQLVEYSANGIVSKRILEKKTGNVSVFSFDAGQKLSEHSAPFDALVEVIDGEAEILINGEPHIITAGESIIMPANIPHALNAVSRFKMVLIMIKEG